MNTDNQEIEILSNNVLQSDQIQSPNLNQINQSFCTNFNRKLNNSIQLKKLYFSIVYTFVVSILIWIFWINLYFFLFVPFINKYNQYSQSYCNLLNNTITTYECCNIVPSYSCIQAPYNSPDCNLVIPNKNTICDNGYSCCELSCYNNTNTCICTYFINNQLGVIQCNLCYTIEQYFSYIDNSIISKIDKLCYTDLKCINNILQVYFLETPCYYKSDNLYQLYLNNPSDITDSDYKFKIFMFGLFTFILCILTLIFILNIIFFIKEYRKTQN